MTAAHISNRTMGRRSRSIMRRAVALIAAPVVIGTIACTDSNVPYFTAPTGVDASPGGIQNAMTGVFAAARLDVSTYIYWMPMFARDVAQIWIDNPQNVQFGTGLTPISTGGTGIWDNSYRAAAAARAVIAAVPNVSPAYTSQQAAALIGVAQTMEAVAYMMVAETRDTLGVPIYPATGSTVGPVLCAKDAWAAIVALLDSANASLTTAGAIPIPVKLPPGFGSVSATAGPSTAQGSFAALNRALAAKAGLQLAYAIARSSAGTSPTPTTAGTLDGPTLTRADSAATNSALFYTTTPLAPPAAGGFADNSSGVYWDYSGQSGDAVNPMNQFLSTWRTLSYLTTDVDTANDKRFLNKFVPNTANALQIPVDAFMNTNWLFNGYSSANSPVPLIRNESLILYDAQIQLGLGNLANAINLINIEHQQAGGYGSPLTIAATYTAVRDTLLKEQRIATVFEASGDRDISIRMYNLASTVDTTWSSAVAKTATGNASQVDLHTTVVPIPASELAGRGGTYTVTCP